MEKQKQIKRNFITNNNNKNKEKSKVYARDS